MYLHARLGGHTALITVATSPERMSFTFWKYTRGWRRPGSLWRVVVNDDPHSLAMYSCGAFEAASIAIPH